MSPRTTTTSRTHVGLRLEDQIVARLDAIRTKLSRPGLKPTISDVVRTVLLAGLPVVERAEGIGQRHK